MDDILKKRRKGLTIGIIFAIVVTGSYQLGRFNGKQAGMDTLPNCTATSSAKIDCPRTVCPQTVECPPERVCLECLPCPVCPSPPPCPECPTLSIPPEITKQHLNMRLAAGKPPAVQHGYYLCLQDTWELYEVPGRPKFYPGPSQTNPEDFYRTIRGTALKEQDNITCFTKYVDAMGEYIILNRTPDQNDRNRWGWNDEQCHSSSLRINHL